MIVKILQELNTVLGEIPFVVGPFYAVLKIFNKDTAHSIVIYLLPVKAYPAVFFFDITDRP